MVAVGPTGAGSTPATRGVARRAIAPSRPPCRSTRTAAAQTPQSFLAHRSPCAPILKLARSAECTPGPPPWNLYPSRTHARPHPTQTAEPAELGRRAGDRGGPDDPPRCAGGDGTPHGAAVGSRARGTAPRSTPAPGRSAGRSRTNPCNGGMIAGEAPPRPGALRPLTSGLRSADVRRQLYGQVSRSREPTWGPELLLRAPSSFWAARLPPDYYTATRFRQPTAIRPVLRAFSRSAC